jgi:hypothetical protein
MPRVKSRSAGGYNAIGAATAADRHYGRMTLVPSPLVVIE